MRSNHNDDRVIKRFLPWVFLLAVGGVLYYLYAPYQDIAPAQSTHDTPSTAQSLTPEENPEPEAAAPPEEPETAPADTQTEQPASSAPAPEPEAPAETAPAPEPPAKTAVQDNTPGQFVKHLYRLGKTGNAWASLQKSKFSPALLRQLQGLQKKLSAPYAGVDILYSDYEKNGETDPANSKILAVQTSQWSYFAKESNGRTLYYDAQGRAPELSMDRVPFAYSRITSPFNLRRLHPITHRIRPHEGVDLKGPYGTPIASTGAGIVTFAGWQSGYGRVVIIEHENSYQTRYGHLSAISVSAGQRVSRGQTIGRLGNSGASTGAHLHYEVRINGTPYDPMTVSLPSYQPLPSGEMKAWKQYAALYLDTISQLKRQ